MKTRNRVALGTLIALVSIGIVVNLPIINTGIIESGCSSFSNCTPPHPVYESLFDKYFPCTFSICSVPMLTVTLSSANLTAGTSTNQNLRGTANLVIAFDNPGSTTKLSSYSLWSPTNTSITLYQCSSSISCTVVSSPTILGNKITSFDTATTMFYVSSNISSGEAYSYVFNFANGQSISGMMPTQ